MYSIVLMTALAAGHGSPAGGFACNPYDWWYRFGPGYGACSGAGYTGWPETGSLCAPPTLDLYPYGPVPAFPQPPAVMPEFPEGMDGAAGRCAAVEAAPAAANRARLIVAIPKDARLYIDDQPVPTETPERSFRTPDLAKDQVYYYEVRAEVMRDGKPVSETRRIAIKAGDVVHTDFRGLGQPADVVSATNP